MTKTQRNNNQNTHFNTPLTIKNTNNTVTEANSQSAVNKLTRKKQRQAAKKYLEERKRLWDAPPKMSSKVTDPYLFTPLKI
jgi:TfoX/Sxy family transcriptional regulator of competence genes